MDQSQLLSLLKPEAARIDEVIAENLKTVDNKKLSEVLQYAIFNGGKRIRPLLAVLAGQLCRPAEKPLDEQEKAQLYQLAITFEYLHVASLLHDDVIDKADKRRGRPAANTIWGVTPVILAGDYLHSRAMFLAGTIGKERILAQISKATAAMVESEFIQMESVESKDQSESSYFKVLQGKTAALIAAACSAGALYQGATDQQANSLNLYGQNIGLAFQIADDLLDYLGNPAKTGKVVGNDFIEGKMTLPLIYALNNSPPTSRQALADMLAKSPDQRPGHLQEATTLIQEGGGFTYSRQKAQTLVDEALDGLKIFPDGPAKNVLLGLSQYVLNRDK